MTLLEIVVNNDRSPEPVANGGKLPPILPPNVIPMSAPRKPRKPAKKKPTPKQRFVRDITELGELSDHLYAAAQNMSNAELIAYRQRLALIIEAVRTLKEDTEVLVDAQGDGNG